MKILSLVLAMSLSLSSFAGVAEDVAALGQLAFGSSRGIKAPGRDAKAVFMSYMGGDFDADRFVYKEESDMDHGDEIEYGFTSAKSADDLSGSVIGWYEEILSQGNTKDKVIQARIKNVRMAWSPLIKKLSSQGVKFGYNGYGPGYCGVSFVQLLVIDVKGQKVYEVYLSQSGEC